jgi:hypothetical protein
MLWRLPRIGSDGKRRKSHANTFLLSRGFFLKNYGYDEGLCGNYGCDDTMFVRFMKYHGACPGMIFWAGVCANVRAFKRDAAGGYTHSLSRDLKPNEALVARKLKEIKTYGQEAGHSREFLNFDWKVVRVTRRPVPPPENKDPFWAWSWWGRCLMGE